MPQNGSSRRGTITYYESQTVYRLTRYISGVNTGYGGCGEATHTQSISERKTKGDQTVRTGLGQFLVRLGVLTSARA